MDRPMDGPSGLRGSPGESPTRRDTADLGPIPGAAAEGPGRSRTGISRWPRWNRGRIGLLLLGLIVLPWLPIPGPPGETTPARRVRGVGDLAVLTFAFAPDGATLATLRIDGRVDLRDAAGGPGLHSILDHPGFARSLAFAPDGRSLAVGGLEPDVFLYDLGAGGAGHPLGMPIRCADHLAFAPDGRTLAVSGHLDHEIRLWDLEAEKERARLRGHGSPVVSLAFAPDGRTLASGAASDRAILLWNPATGRPLRRLGVPPGPVSCLAYSPDGRWLASTGSLERLVRLWDLEGRRGDRLIGTHSRASRSVAFAPDGRLLATAGIDGLVRLWDPATGADCGGWAGRAIGSNAWPSRPTAGHWPPPGPMPTSASGTWASS